MAKLAKKSDSNKILSIEDFNSNLLSSFNQNVSFVNPIKSSQKYQSYTFELPEFKSKLTNNLEINKETESQNEGEILYAPKPLEELEELEEFNIFEEQEDKKEDNKIITTKYPSGIKSFNDAFDAVQIKIPEIKKYRKFLTELAYRESSFRPDAVAGNANGAALGYFQFMPFNRKGISSKDFVNNPRLQIEMAWKLLKEFKGSFNSVDWAKARNKGYTESAMIAGAWLSGAGGVKRFLKTGYKAQDNLGTNVKNYMDRFNKLV